MPPRDFKALPSEDAKYDGKEEPKAWIDDYLQRVIVMKGNKTAAMQCFQLYLRDSARAWLRGLPKESIKSWEGLVEAFVKNFQATYQRPVGIAEIRQCKQKSNEPVRSYIGRFTKLINAAEDISVDRAIDAFNDGLRREAHQEELGKLRPKTISELMDIAVRWADGEDHVRKGRTRSDDEDEDRRNDHSGRRDERRKKRRNRNYESGDGLELVAAGYADRRDDHRDDRRDDRRDYRRDDRQYRGNYQGGNQAWKPRTPRAPELPAHAQLDAPCYIHSYFDQKDQRRKSTHTLRECRQFIELQQIMREANIAPTTYPAVPGAVAPNAPPPPPGGPPQANMITPANGREQFPPARGQLNMIHKTARSKREQKKFTREVNLAETSMSNYTEYVDWSDQAISFSRADHPKAVPRPGHASLVVQANIGGFNMSKVFMDGGSALNLLFANSMAKMGISKDQLSESDCTFHGIVPTMPVVPLGKITLEVAFGDEYNFRLERLEFEVVDWESQYHAILGRPAYAKFMIVPHYTYLMMKMPGNAGYPITVYGSFSRSDNCDRDFNKISAKYTGLKEFIEVAKIVDHHTPPPDNRIEDASAATPAEPTKKLQIAPDDKEKTANVAADLSKA